MAEETASKGKEWFVASDFVMDEFGDVFVGYEASARLSELSNDYPQIIETAQHGRFKARRIKTNNIAPYLNDLPQWMQDILCDSKVYNPSPFQG